MRYLIICESSSHSANYNIAVRLAHELKKNHEVYMGYFPPSGEAMRTEGVDGELSWMDDTLEKAYYKLKNIQGQRILFFMMHPVFFIAKVLDRGFLAEHSRKLFFMVKVSIFCLNKGIDAVIGITEPHITAKVVSGLWIQSKKYVIQLDPYAYQYTVKGNEQLKKRRLREEIRVFNKIDKLYTTKLIKKDLLHTKVFRDKIDHIQEIEFPMIDRHRSSEIVDNNAIITGKSGEVSFLHCGNFYADIRDPQKLVSLFKLLPENYILYVAGSNSESIREYDEEIRDRVVDLGCLSLEDAARARVEADILISYNNLVDNQVPSKLFECINEGKPFINLCQLSECPTLTYVKDYEMAYTIFTFAMDKGVEGLVEFAEEMKGKRAEKSYIAERYNKCTIEYFAESIVNGNNE